MRILLCILCQTKNVWYNNNHNIRHAQKGLQEKNPFLLDAEWQKRFYVDRALGGLAIIGLLASTVMIELNGARLKGRDAKRIADIKMLQKSLVLYLDTCGGYPMLGSGAYVTIAAGGLDTSTADGDCASSGVSFGTFMPILPVDPRTGTSSFGYCSTEEDAPFGASSCDNSGSADYQVTFTLEGDTGSLPAGARTATPNGIF
jgi:hypothetical protein